MVPEKTFYIKKEGFKFFQFFFVFFTYFFHLHDCQYAIIIKKSIFYYQQYMEYVKESRKKSSSFNGPAITRGMEGCKGPVIKKKKNLFEIFLPLKIKKYFTLDNLSKYGHITLKFVDRYIIWVVKKINFFAASLTL